MLWAVSNCDDNQSFQKTVKLAQVKIEIRIGNYRSENLADNDSIDIDSDNVIQHSNNYQYSPNTFAFDPKDHIECSLSQQGPSKGIIFCYL